ncbi:hypothetical protein [Bradyrhizobium icense]|uniref:hypothetical protein n=1 Tax=Bradyrhizobium icense TaxID=1274631 RepID=UPI0012EA6BBE|nr:hypothetical protein [Bradyrhizobium icense]
MIAKIAYLTTPGPDRFVFNFQAFGSEELQSIEISKAHLANIIIDGTSLALRETSIHRVPTNTNQGQRDDNPTTVAVHQS